MTSSQGQGNLHGKTALVTGGGKGIGSAIALALAGAGADVAVNFAHSQAGAEDVAERCRALGVRAKAYLADVSNAAQVKTMVEQVHADLGQVLIVVNNAGINRDRSFVKMEPGQWNEVLAANLSGPFHVIQAVLGDMLTAGWGRIINIASMNGQMGSFGQANYCASKGGMISLTYTLARELARKGITANVVSPGFTETDMTHGIPPDVLEKIKQGIPMGRLGSPEEIASAVRFLAGPETSYITGQVIGVNGGAHMG